MPFHIKGQKLGLPSIQLRRGDERREDHKVALFQN